MIARLNFTGLLAALLLAVSASAADLTVIDLHNRTADEVLPALRPLVGSDVVLSGIDYKLLVRGAAEDVARIREALTVLDRTPRQLIVSVRYTGHPQGRSTDLGLGGTITNSGSQIEVRAGTATRTAEDSSVSSVRVLEGNGAHISSGQSVPTVTAVLWGPRSGRRNVVGGVATDYRELNSGFDVLPRVNGDRVMLDIATQQERATDQGQVSTTVQRATTTVAGRLGEWIEIGGVTSSISEQSTSVGLSGGARRVTTQSDQRTIAVKVEQVQ
jgi:type II secretory pathway component GspD/PulD (secretin)